MGTHEYPDMACEFFGYSVPDEFDSEDHEGCNLRFSEALVLEFLLDDDYEPTEDKELQGKHKKKEKLYKAYLEKLREKRKDKKDSKK
jgi:hypothetical protein